MAQVKKYFRGQGSVMFSLIDTAGDPISFRRVANAPEVEFNFEVEKSEHIESESGNGNVDHVDYISRKGGIKLKLEQFSPENLSQAMGGLVTVIPSGTVTTDPLGSATTAVGDILALKHQKVSSVVIKDSTGSPVTLTPGTHYKANEKHGSVEILDLTGITLPLLIDYGYAEVTAINMSTVNIPNVAIRLEGLNAAEGGEAVLISVYKAALDPAKVLKMLSGEMMSIDLEGSMLYDGTKSADAVLGQMGSVILID